MHYSTNSCLVIHAPQPKKPPAAILQNQFLDLLETLDDDVPELLCLPNLPFIKTPPPPPPTQMEPGVYEVTNSSNRMALDFNRYDCLPVINQGPPVHPVGLSLCGGKKICTKP